MIETLRTLHNETLWFPLVMLAFYSAVVVISICSIVAIRRQSRK